MIQGSENRGAALIIAVAIFTILLVVALTFYSSSKIELQTATNVENGMRTDLISNAGIALAVSMIQNDAQLYPHATSIDHPWTTYFNGTWIAGKPWAFANGVPWAPNPFTGFDRNSIPYVVYDQVLAMEADFDFVINDIVDDMQMGDFSRAAELASLQMVRAPLYVPRFQGNPSLASLRDPATNAFVIDYAFDQTLVDPNYNPSTDGAPTAPQLTPQQQIAFWADVDNDEDGLPDSVWIPVPIELFFGGVDKDEDGIVSVDEGGDGIDNDLDAFWGGSDLKDNDGDIAIDEADEQRFFNIDEENETAVFVYWGGNDGRDNDADGFVDEGDEEKLFLTAPIVDQDGFPMFNNIDVQVNQAVLKRFAYPDLDPATVADINTVVQNPQTPPFTGGGDVDAIDNDYSMIVSDSKGFGYSFPPGFGTIDLSNPGGWTPAEQDAVNQVRQNASNAYNLINTDAYPTIAPYEVVSASGEPVCEIAGRVAVLITDEASKINLNSAGGLAMGPAGQLPANGVRLTWAANEGVGPHEVDIRSVPNFGPGTGRQLAQIRGGSPEGGVPFDINTNLNAAPYDYDAALPGYGGVDDNGNALWMSMNGIDDDGDAFYYLYDGIDNDFNGTVDNAAEYFVGVDELWEGIDEPAEHQLFRPLRNSLAETDALDNDLDDSVDEIGELGDRLFRTQDQSTLVSGIGPANAQWLRNSITTQSTDRNQRNQYYTRDGNGNMLQQLIPPTSGLKLDYNYALADNIALALQEDWDYPAFTDTLASIPETRYADGLRREDVTVVNAPYGYFDDFGNIVFDADAELRSYQLALNIMEHRDRDHAGNYAEVRTPDRWWLFDVPFADGGGFVGPGPNDIDPSRARQITYRMRGAESIRITELMVRPVRRVEAEADIADTTVPPQYDPNLFSDAEGRPDDFDYGYEIISTRIPGFDPPLGENGTDDWTQLGPGHNSPLEAFITDTTEIEDPLGSVAVEVPNVMQFRFGPSPQLPPGRYYLMFNSNDENGIPTVDNSADVRFRVKYATAADNDIIGDMLDYGRGFAAFDPFVDLDATVSTPQVGAQSAVNPVTPGVGNPPSGWVFLPTSAADQTTAIPVEAEGYAGVPGVGNPKNEAFTVVIPPYAVNQVYLYVAIHKDSNDSEPFAINFFDFSQEPDHEWVEVTNIAEDPNGINIGGWQLEVGGDVSDAGRRLFQVPPNTTIAPGGSLLLGFNKYDVGSENFDLNLAGNPYTGIRDFTKNGIGLVRGPAGGDLAGISEPPIPRYAAPSETGFAFVNAWGITLANGSGADSVFFRVEDEDFVDMDGDGVGEGFAQGLPDVNDDLITSANDVPPSGIDPGFTAAGTPATKAWDRIIQLEPILSDELLAVSTTETGQLANTARMVLGGGVLPNYPEFDLLDNDQDNLALMTDEIDNDGDGFIDIADTDEGIDEGRYRRENGLVVPGAFDDEFVDFGFATVPPNYVMGSGANLWWDWKNFVERRYFPGDNVIVTLYDGVADAGRIADRVTYSQHDVENRSFDDKISCPYPPTEIPNAGIEWAWPANTMGLDFYKSLERRHPLFNGDRVGTQNRWLATDGNYDDWHEGTARFSRSEGPVMALGEVLFGHGFSGSPLRPNFYQRRLEQPGVLVDHDPGVGSFIWTFDRAKVRNRQLASIGDLMTVPHMTIEKRLGEAGSEILGAEYLYGDGVMLGRDFPMDLRAVLETGRLDSIVLSVATADFYPLYPRISDIGPPGDDPTLVEWSGVPGGLPNSLGIPPRAWSPVFLMPLDPGGSEPPYNTITVTAASVPAAFPQLRDGPAYPVQLNFLQGPIATYPGTTPADYLQDPLSPAPRWPLETRAVMYVSANPADFDPYAYDHNAATPVGITTDHPSEALFVWDGDDGLPNGEYDLYVVTLDDITGLIANNTQIAENASDFAKAFVARALAADPTQTAVDVGVLTDRNGDRRVWEDTGNRLPDTAELGQTVMPPGVPGESYGLKTGLTPASDGSIHYGVVKVENNYLAVFIRNWAPPGALNRVSRVVLTTRDKTTGRINVNTAITRMVQTNNPPTNPGNFSAYNPLVGLPGVFGEYQPDDILTPANDAFLDVRRILPWPGSPQWPPSPPAPPSSPFAFIPALYRTIGDDDIFPTEDLDYDRSTVYDGTTLNDPLGRAERISAATARGLAGGDPAYSTMDRLDGRYYQFQSELVARGDNLITGPSLQLTPSLLAPDLVVPGSESLLELADKQAAQFDEMLARYKSIANIITARSDVFEIIVTAQSGYGFDANGDGLINWRDDEEFVVNGERKSRTVYER